MQSATTNLAARKRRILPFSDFPPPWMARGLRTARVPQFLCSADSNPFTLATLPSIWELDAEVEWLVKDLIPESAVTLLSGETGHGKSWLALSLACSVAHGQDFLGLQTSQRDALIVDKENSAAIYRQRLEVLHVAPTPRMYVWGLWNERQPEGPSFSLVVNFVKEHDHPLIVFDSLIAFHPGSEQDSAETRRYMDGFRQLAALGATVLVIHHTGKGENTKQYRGSSDILASVDMAYLVSKRTASSDSLKITSLALKPFKTRTGEPEPIKIEFVEGQFMPQGNQSLSIVAGILQKNPRSNQSAVVKYAAGKLSQNQVRAALDKGERDGLFQVSKGAYNAKLYSLRDAKPQCGASADRLKLPVISLADLPQ